MIKIFWKVETVRFSNRTLLNIGFDKFRVDLVIRINNFRPNQDPGPLEKPDLIRFFKKCKTGSRTATLPPSALKRMVKYIPTVSKIEIQNTELSKNPKMTFCFGSTIYVLKSLKVKVDGYTLVSQFFFIYIKQSWLENIGVQDVFELHIFEEILCQWSSVLSVKFCINGRFFFVNSIN